MYKFNIRLTLTSAWQRRRGRALGIRDDPADGGIQVQQIPQVYAGDFLAGVLGELLLERTHELMRMGDDEAERAWYSRFDGRCHEKVASVRQQDLC